MRTLHGGLPPADAPPAIPGPRRRGGCSGRAATLAHSHLGRPLLWNPNGAWHYPNASLNARGDVGGVAYFSTPTSFPSPVVIVRDDFTAGPAPWDAFFLTLGAAGNKGWGDYVRSRACQPSLLGWGISAYSMQPTGAGAFGAESRYYLVARDRDLPSLINWWQK